jgi:hypothetical protein
MDFSVPIEMLSHVRAARKKAKAVIPLSRRNAEMLEQNRARKILPKFGPDFSSRKHFRDRVEGPFRLAFVDSYVYFLVIEFLAEDLALRFPGPATSWICTFLYLHPLVPAIRAQLTTSLEISI